MLGIGSDEWKAIGAAISAFAAFFGFKNWQTRREKMALAAEDKLNKRFDQKADMKDLERLASETAAKSDLELVEKDVQRLKGDVQKSKVVEATLFEYLREEARQRNEQHAAVMAQLIDINKRLPK